MSRISISEVLWVCCIISYSTVGLCLSIAIEKIVERALRQKKIKGSGGIQEQLDKIFKLDEFRHILQEELKARGLRETDVRRCLSIIYPALSRYAHGNDGHIVLRGLYHPDNERAGLVALLRVQGRWEDSQAWSEEPTEAHYDTGSSQVTNSRAPTIPASAHSLPTARQPGLAKALRPQPRTSRNAR